MIDHYKTRGYGMLLRRLFCAVWLKVDVVRQIYVDVRHEARARRATHKERVQREKRELVNSVDFYFHIENHRKQLQIVILPEMIK